MCFFTLGIFFFFNDTATTEIYTLSLHDALPISPRRRAGPAGARAVLDRARCGSGHEPHGRRREALAPWQGPQARGHFARHDARVGAAEGRRAARRRRRRESPRIPPAARGPRGAGADRGSAARPASAHRVMAGAEEFDPYKD